MVVWSWGRSSSSGCTQVIISGGVDKRCRDTRDNYLDVQILCEVGEGDGSNHIASCYLSIV